MEARPRDTHEVFDNTKRSIALQGSGQDCADFSYKNRGRTQGFSVRRINRN